jgi:uncharacterized peroxidase-related enzyme
MPHITIAEGQPGIRGPFYFRKQTAKPLLELGQALMRGPSSLTDGERELIASFVSSQNTCTFCHSSHGATAACLLGSEDLVNAVKKDFRSAGISDKMKALLHIADKVRIDPKTVSADDIAAARAHGADDVAIHDTVLVAAAFSMFNRYVDGLATWQPEAPEAYREMGQKMAEHGYLREENRELWDF